MREMKETFKLNHANETIELTKQFAKASGKYGSEEYKLLMEVKKDFPNYKVVVRDTQKRKKTRDNFNGLTYDYMERYIKKNNDKLIVEFSILRGKKEDMDGLFKSRSYSQIKKWFLAKFPEIKNYEMSRTELINKPEVKENSETMKLEIQQQEESKKVA